MIPQIWAAMKWIRQYQSLKPMIAGNCLWDWAAGRAARDVDVWIRSGIRARWRLRRLVPTSARVMGYGYIDHSRISVRRSILIDGTDLDIIHSREDPRKVFDYVHLMMGWSPRGVDTDLNLRAAATMSTGQFGSGLFDAWSPRSIPTVRAKLRDNPLWGAPLGTVWSAVTDLGTRLDDAWADSAPMDVLPRAWLLKS